jgi:hypothetical protein
MLPKKIEKAYTAFFAAANKNNILGHYCPEHFNIGVDNLL